MIQIKNNSVVSSHTVSSKEHFMSGPVSWRLMP